MSITQRAAIILAIGMVAVPHGVPPAIAESAAMAALSGNELVQTLHGGGYVIYFRHAKTDQSTADTDRTNIER